MSAKQAKCRGCDGTGEMRYPTWRLHLAFHRCHDCGGTGLISEARETNAESVREQRMARQRGTTGAPNQCPKCDVKGGIDSSPMWGTRCRCRVCGHWFDSVHAALPSAKLCEPAPEDVQ